MHEAQRRLGDRVQLRRRSSYDALEGADALVVVTEWNEFRSPDFARLKQTLRSRSSSTAATSTTLQQMRALGFTYYSIGAGGTVA